MKFITNIYIEKSNTEKIINQGGGGRCRGIIKNEGFNEQKNHYNFEHLYTTNYEVHKAYYYLLQITHAIIQFLIVYTYKNKKRDFQTLHRH